MAYQARQSWVEIRKSGDFQSVAEKFGVSPVIARILRNREITEDEEIRMFLYGTLDDLINPLRMDHLKEAADLLHEKILLKKQVRIIGDYDADGICSTVILYDMLREAGCRISCDVPDRMKDGFGMNVRLIEKAFEEGIDTIITCDNGIAATDAVKKARELGMTVIITDHHEPNYEILEDGEKHFLLPDADLIVDPKKPGCEYPFKDLCGAAVAWKLMHVFESRYLAGEKDRVLPVRDCPFTLKNLPIAAIATVTDVMKLTFENRILVKTGLSMLPNVENVGLQALIEACNLSGKPMGTYHIGFILGPCLNAGGRLDTAMRGIRLLLEKDPVHAVLEAKDLSALNTERKDLTEEGRRQAFEMIENTPLIDDRVLIVYLSGIHESIAGIIASKVKETFCRPVIILTDTEDPGLIKGSGRSIEAYNMHAELTKISDLFVKFGGHPMAAGVTLRRDKLEELRRRINENCTLTMDDLIRKIRIDMRLPFRAVTRSLVRELELLSPGGPGNPAPLFAQSALTVTGMRVLGKNRNAVRLKLVDNGTPMDAIWFGDASLMESFLEEKSSAEEVSRLKRGQGSSIKMTVAFYPEINEYGFSDTLQIRIAHFM